MTIVAAIFASERIFTGYVVKWFTDAIVERDARLLLNALRSVPELVWAALLIIAAGVAVVATESFWACRAWRRR